MCMDKYIFPVQIHFVMIYQLFHMTFNTTFTDSIFRRLLWQHNPLSVLAELRAKV